MHEHAVLVCQLSSRRLLSTQNAELEVLNEPTDEIYSYNLQDLKTELLLWRFLATLLCCHAA